LRNDRFLRGNIRQQYIDRGRMLRGVVGALHTHTFELRLDLAIDSSDISALR
jgi:hypothetical protein